MQKIAFLGMGAMGRRMAARLLSAGYAVTVWNRTADACDAMVAAGARTASSPSDAARGADIVIAMLRDDGASRAVWLDPETGALPALKPHAVAVECSTLTPAWIGQLAGACEARGVDFAECPVAGSLPQAEGGQLHILAGGPPETIDRVRTVLLAMGTAVHHCGPNGTGAAVKLAVNTLYGVQIAALAEIQGFLRLAGLDLATAVEILGGLPICSPAAALAAKAMLGSEFPAAFPVDLVDKDFGYLTATAAAQGGAMPVAGAASGVFRHAVARGLGADNITGVVQLYR